MPDEPSSSVRPGARWSSWAAFGVALALGALSFAGIDRPAPVWLRLAGIGLLVAAACARWWPAATALWRDAIGALRPNSRDDRLHLIALGAIVAVAIVVRATMLGVDTRHDEAFTFQVFVQWPLSRSMSEYGVPNNHLFHTFLAHGAWRVFGDQNWALRLPVFLAGIALVPAIYAAGRVLYGRAAGLLAAALAAGATSLIEYSAYARGYGITWLAVVLLIVLGERVLRMRDPVAWTLWAAIAALGLFTVPVMALALAAVSAWMGVELLVRRQAGRLWELVAALAGAGALAALLYRDTFGDPAWSYEKEVPYSAGELVVDVWEAITAPLAGPLSVAVLALAVAGIALHLRIGKTPISLPLVTVLVIPMLVLVLPDPPPFQRSWLWVAPLALMAAAAGLVALTRPLAGRIPAPAAAAAAVVVAVAIAVAMRTSDPPWSEAVPVIGAHELAQWLRDSPPPPGPVLIPAFTTPPISLEMARAGVPFESRILERWLAPETPTRVLVVVSRTHDQTLASELRYWGIEDRVPGRPRRVARLGELDVYDVAVGPA